MKNVLAKLGASDRTHAAMIALKRGTIDFQQARGLLGANRRQRAHALNVEDRAA